MRCALIVTATAFILCACGRPQERPVRVAEGAYVGPGSGEKARPYYLVIIDSAGVARIAEYTGGTTAISSSIYAPSLLLTGTSVSSPLAVYQAGQHSAGTGVLRITLDRFKVEGTITSQSGGAVPFSGARGPADALVWQPGSRQRRAAAGCHGRHQRLG
jgi:hypothetical protein